MFFANQPGVTATQVGKEIGINANLISRWRRGLGPKAFTGQGKPRDEKMAAQKCGLSRVKKERDFYEKWLWVNKWDGVKLPFFSRL